MRLHFLWRQRSKGTFFSNHLVQSLHIICWETLKYYNHLHDKSWIKMMFFYKNNVCTGFLETLISGVKKWLRKMHVQLAHTKGHWRDMKQRSEDKPLCVYCGERGSTKFCVRSQVRCTQNRTSKAAWIHSKRHAWVLFFKIFQKLLSYWVFSSQTQCLEWINNYNKCINPVSVHTYF